MFKRILYTLMILLALSSIGFASYRFFESKDNKQETYGYTMIEYEGAKQYVLSHGNSSTTFLFFCSHNNENCNYIEDTLYPDVNKRLDNKNMNTLIDYVNIEPLEDSLKTENLMADWSINNYPAFVSVSVIDDQLVINNSLVWNSESPINTNDILAWFQENGQYEGVINQQVLMP